jgi:hypothetical protein
LAVEPEEGRASGAQLVFAACLVFGIVAVAVFAGVGTAPFNVLLDKDGSVWIWAERLSWLAALIAIGIGLPQLQILIREQRRIATEFSRRPELMVELVWSVWATESAGPKPDSSEASPPVLYIPTPRRASVVIEVTTENVGGRTARNIQWDVGVDKVDLLEARQSSSHDWQHVTTNSVSHNEQQLHPGERFVGLLHADFWTSRTSVDVVVTVWMDDARPLVRRSCLDLQAPVGERHSWR